MTLAYDDHNIYFEDALAKFDRRAFAESQASWDEAIARRDTPHARWNRGQARLSQGDFRAFTEDFPARWQVFANLVTDRGRGVLDRLPRWLGEHAKRIVLVHECGFGDTVQMLRYVAPLKQRGIEPVLCVPPELQRLAAQLARIGDHGDCCCPMFDLPARLHARIENVPCAPYLKVDPEWRAAWESRIPVGRRKIGIAWTSGRWHERDFKRSIPLETFLNLLQEYGSDVYSLQQQGAEDAVRYGVRTFEYRDFADVAAVASFMDEVVCIDTAAVHVAAATGHPDVSVMLPYLSSWRWTATRVDGTNPWYPHVKRYQQLAPNDWRSAFEQRTR